MVHGRRGRHRNGSASLYKEGIRRQGGGGAWREQAAGYTTEIEDTENGVEKDQQQRGTVGHHQRSTLTIKKQQGSIHCHRKAE